MKQTRLVGLGLACAIIGAPVIVAADPTSPPAAAPAPTATPPTAAQPDATSGAPAPAAPTVAWVYRPKPPIFMDRSSSGSVLLGGALGAVAQMSVGASEVADDHIEDPGDRLAAKIAAAYAPGLGATVAAPPVTDQSIRRNWNAKDYAAIAGGARYVVDVQSGQEGTVWASYVTWPLDLSHYIVHYQARVKIEDVVAGKELFSGACDVYTKRRPGLPTHDEMYANGGQILKAMIVETTDQCLDKLVDKGLQTPPKAPG
jgi:hypothetical protein